MPISYSPRQIRCKNHTLVLDHTLIVGILNVTPDSFSDGGQYFESGKAIAHAKQMVADGADIVDIGGESTRPGSERISKEEELRRVLPVLEALLAELSVPISVDTMKWEVAEECLKRGADMINDVTGLRDKKMAEVVAQFNVPVVIMHMAGTPETMQVSPRYENVIQEIKQYLKTQVEFAMRMGIEQVIIDPGIGFGKTLEHNLLIFKRLNEFRELGYPLLIGPSRKSFLQKILGLPAEDRLEGTLAAVTASVLNGGDIIRVHDVRACKRAVLVAEAIRNVKRQGKERKRCFAILVYDR